MELFGVPHPAHQETDRVCSLVGKHMPEEAIFGERVTTPLSRPSATAQLPSSASQSAPQRILFLKKKLIWLRRIFSCGSRGLHCIMWDCLLQCGLFSWGARAPEHVRSVVGVQGLSCRSIWDLSSLTKD